MGNQVDEFMAAVEGEKEADVSEQKRPTAEDIRRWEHQHDLGGQAVAAKRLRQAAAAIEALQQRCDELEHQLFQSEKRESEARGGIDNLNEGIAALEERMQGVWDRVCEAPELNMGNYNEDDVSALNQALIDLYQFLQPEVLSAREEPEECPNLCRRDPISGTGWILDHRGYWTPPEGELMEGRVEFWKPCPIHGTGRKGELREQIQDDYAKIHGTGRQSETYRSPPAAGYDEEDWPSGDKGPQSEGG